MSEETTFYQRSKEAILSRAKNCYEINKDLLWEKARKKYKELSEEKKNIRREHGRNKYHNMSGGKKQRLKEYQRDCREAKKSQFSDQYINKVKPK